MPNYIQTGGQNTIYKSSSTGPSTSWVQVHPSIRNITFQAVHSGSTLGSTVNVSSVINIEASNDGVNPVLTKLGTITFSTVSAPASDGFTIDAHWNFVRANVASISTGSVSVIVSAKAPL